MSNKNWYDELCEYYKVTPEMALELGTRKTNRRPSLPASLTTHAVSNLTYEEIWALKPRDTQEQIFEFYKDQGAWSSFRQVVRHKDMTSTHFDFLTKTVKNNSSFCEYGCGIAPFTFTLLQNISNDVKLHVCLSDLDCEHFTFGVWRTKKLIKDRSLTNVELEVKTIKPDLLPTYSKKLDTVFIFEVLEHVPSPVATLQNLSSQLNVNGAFCENFIKHVHNPDELPGSDLESAANEREEYYKILKSDFVLSSGGDPESFSNQTRIWRKK